MRISTRCRDLITCADMVSSVSVMCMSLGLGTNYWYQDGDTHVGLWEWHLCEYLSICVWMVLTNNAFVDTVMTLMFAGITLSVLSMFLLTLALQRDVYVTFNLVCAGVSLLLSGLCTAFATGIYAAGLRVLASARIVYSDHFGYSFYLAVIGAFLSIVACVIALSAVCVLSEQTHRHV